MKKIQKAFIDVIIFPPHFTHLIQPLDVTVARPLKQALKRFAKDLLENIDPSTLSMISFLRLTQVIAIIDAVRAASLTSNCKIGFKNCGLFPCNEDEVLQKSGIKNSKKSFIDFSSSNHSPMKISGHCITRDDVIENLRDKKEIDEKKKRKRKNNLFKKNPIQFFLCKFCVF